MWCGGLYVSAVCQGMGLFLEETFVETFKTLTVTGFVFSHFVNGVVDGIEVELFCTGSNAHFVFVCACFGSHAFFKVGLGVPHAVSEQFGELRCMFSLFPSITLESLGDFRISLASA